MRRSNWTLVILAICAIVLIGVSAPVSATTRTVPAQYNTIQAAYNACSAGDTVEISAGTYYEHPYFSKSGTAANPITVRPASGAAVYIDGQNQNGSDGDNDVIMISGDYNIVRGLDITNGQMIGIDVYGSHNTIKACCIYNNGNVYDNQSGYGQCGIYENHNVSYNVFDRNWIDSNGRVSKTGYGNDPGLYLCGNYGLVTNNVICYNCSFGIQVAGYNTVHSMKIYNNTIVNNHFRSGIVLWLDMSGVDIANNIIYGNNTGSYGAGGYGIMTSECTGSGVNIRNNLIYNEPDGNWNMTYGSTVSYSTSNNITGQDPKFVNNSNDWDLQSDSPAKDAGVTLTSDVPYDYPGYARPYGSYYDIGAYEYH